MALSAEKLAYHRAYRAAHKEATKAAYKRWYEKRGIARYNESLELYRAKSRKFYNLACGKLDKAAEEQALFDSIRLSSPAKMSGAKVMYSDTERISKRKAVYRKVRYRNVAGIPTFEDPGVCEICGGTDKICFDHDHDTQVFRGWICDNCNIVIGRVKEDVGTLKKMIEYLERKVQLNA